MTERRQSLPQEDLIAEAVDWNARLSANDVDRQSDKELVAWLEKSPEHAEALAATMRVEALAQDLSGHLSVDAADTVSVQDTPKLSGWGWPAGAAMAAVMLMTIGVGILWAPQKDLHIAEPTAAYRLVSLDGFKEGILPDGSTVTLSPQSSVRFSTSSDGVRRAELSGAASFSIERDPGAAPFTVDAGEIEVTVLGTEFDINAYGSKTIVRVDHGSVAVNAASQNLGIVESGEAVGVDEHDDQWTVSALDARLLAIWDQGRLRFAAEGLGEVVETLNQIYGQGTFSVSAEASNRVFAGQLILSDKEQTATALASLLDLEVQFTGTSLELREPGEAPR